MDKSKDDHQVKVHGGIRHLERYGSDHIQSNQVHGGIRHLEITGELQRFINMVHGGIRHLENNLRIT